MSNSALNFFDTAQVRTTDSDLETFFKDAPYHRARDVGMYDVDKLVADRKANLLRSTQEFLPNSTGYSRRLYWVSLLFQLEDTVFLQITAKTSNYNSNQGFEGTYTVVVHAHDPRTAASSLEKVMKSYSGPRPDEGPAFYIVKDLRGTPTRVPLDHSALMDNSTLDLHYGSGFFSWVGGFAQAISGPGLSILKGPPGTGKTSFLRHLIVSLLDTHRFYYVPVEHADILSGSKLHNLWAQEERNYPTANKVIVLEDAETVLSDRKSAHSSNVSGILNLTDGFVADLIRVHLICTINCETDFLDSAILRPGRQRAFREFRQLTFEEASDLAKELNVQLLEKRPYSIAEIYALTDKVSTSLLSQSGRRIGF